MYHVTSQQTALCKYTRKLMHHACKLEKQMALSGKDSMQSRNTWVRPDLGQNCLKRLTADDNVM